MNSIQNATPKFIQSDTYHTHQNKSVYSLVAFFEVKYAHKILSFGASYGRKKYSMRLY